MMIYIQEYPTGGGNIPFTKFNFPGGELQVKLTDVQALPKLIEIVWLYQSDAELMEVALLKDALHNAGVIYIGLFIPYLPYARQDRICSTGESFALKVFATQINTMEFSYVECQDPHNVEICEALFDKFLYIEQATSVSLILKDFLDGVDYILFPDAGALKKESSYDAMMFNHSLRRAVGSKKRNPDTGALTGFDVDVQDFKGANVLVVDDICDGGGTFLGLGAVLRERNCGKLSLFTTHGIYSKGMDELEKMFDGGVYCAYRKLNPI